MERPDPGTVPDDPSDAGAGAARAPSGVPDLTLYGRPGCGLCAETRSRRARILRRGALAAGPVASTLVERDITSDPELERRFLVEIPVDRAR